MPSVGGNSFIMGKKKKKKQRYYEQNTDNGSELERRKRNGKKLLIIAGLFCVFELLYQGLLQLEKRYFPLFPVSVYVLAGILGTLFIIYLIMNRGNPKEKTTPEELSPKIPYDERVALCEKYNKRKEKSHVLIYFIVALSGVLALDFIMLFLFPIGGI